jgi:serine/threonine protein kinase
MWALGIVLYELMYSIHPYENKNNFHLSVLISKGEIKSPPKEKEKIYSSELQNILKSLLSIV